MSDESLPPPPPYRPRWLHVEGPRLPTLGLDEQAEWDPSCDMLISREEAWGRLARGLYMRDWVPHAALSELIGLMQACLDAADLPLDQAHHLRLRWAMAALEDLERPEKQRRARFKLLMSSPNFRDLLRARVLASRGAYTALLEAYHALLRRVVLPRLSALLGERSFAVQREPSLRFNLPGCSALGARGDDPTSGHGDADECVGLHTDSEYGHQHGEMNFMLSLTNVFGSNGLFVESAPGRGDFCEVQMDAGSLFAFHGVANRHHNKRNRTGASRVSMDFRVIPLSRYDATRTAESEAKLHREDRFTLGEYFELIEAGEGDEAQASGEADGDERPLLDTV